MNSIATSRQLSPVFAKFANSSVMRAKSGRTFVEGAFLSF